MIFNALIIIALIPLALRGVTYRPLGAAALLRRSLLVYGVGGVIAPFVGIKIIDVMLAAVASGLGDDPCSRQSIIALRATLVTLVLTGLLYPLVVTGLGAGAVPGARPTAASSPTSTGPSSAPS